MATSHKAIRGVSEILRGGHPPQHSVYFDANATTPLLPEVFEVMKFWLFDQYRDASAGHAHSRAARAAIEGARQKVADLLRCSGMEVLFTSGGMESDNLAIFGKVTEPGAHIVTSSIEHYAVLRAVDEQLRTAKAIHPRNTRPHRAFFREGRR